MILISGIMFVLLCYDIEIYLDGYNMLKVLVDCIMFIGFVVYKNDEYVKFCFMYYKLLIQILEIYDDDMYVVMF